MELLYFQKLWLKIVACFCCTSNNEIPLEKPTDTKTEEQEQKTKPQEESEQFDKNQRRMFNGALSNPAQTQLFQGIEESNHLKIKSAIDHGANVNAPINGLYPLECAIRNGKDYIIEFLLERGAEIKPSHVELALMYKSINETNLNDTDIHFYQDNEKQKTEGQKREYQKRKIEEEIRQYHMIAAFLQLEMYRRQQKQKREQQDSSGASATAAPKNKADLQLGQPPLSERPRVVTFTEPLSDGAAAAAKAFCADDDK
jgi:ankyrin repeat protein